MAPRIVKPVISRRSSDLGSCRSISSSGSGNSNDSQNSGTTVGSFLPFSTTRSQPSAQLPPKPKPRKAPLRKSVSFDPMLGPSSSDGLVSYYDASLTVPLDLKLLKQELKLKEKCRT